MAGTVSLLTSYPLKSALGVPHDSVEVLHTGLAGDRRWALARDGEVLGAKQAPEVANWRTRVADDALLIDAGAGWLPAKRVAAEFGYQLVEATGSEHQMSAAVHLVSVNAEHSPTARPGCDPVVRANLVLSLPQPGAEVDWLGREVRIGTAVLAVTKLPKHCLGVYAAVVSPGVVSLGDPIRLS